MLVTYPIAIVKDARYAELAREFVALVRSAEGQRVLEKRGLIAAGAAP